MRQGHGACRRSSRCLQRGYVLCGAVGESTQSTPYPLMHCLLPPRVLIWSRPICMIDERCFFLQNDRWTYLYLKNHCKCIVLTVIVVPLRAVSNPDELCIDRCFMLLWFFQKKICRVYMIEKNCRWKCTTQRLQQTVFCIFMIFL
jgi:hypothetical protein